MSYNYRKVRRKVMSGEEAGKTKTYAVAKAAGVCDMNKLCKLVSARSSISSADVRSVIDNLVWVMEVELESGNLVKLADFGTYKISIRTQGSENEKDFTAANIRKSRLVFTPGVKLRKIAAGVSFGKDEVVTKIEYVGQPSPETDPDPDDD